MHFSIVDQLAFLTGRSHDADTGVVSYPSDLRKAPQTAPFAMGLEDRVNRFRGNLATIVESIKGLAEGLVAALRAFTCLAMLMGFQMTA